MPAQNSSIPRSRTIWRTGRAVDCRSSIASAGVLADAGDDLDGVAQQFLVYVRVFAEFGDHRGGFVAQIAGLASTSANSHSTPTVGLGDPAKSIRAGVEPPSDDTAGHPRSGVAGRQGGLIRWRVTVDLLVTLRRDVGEVVGLFVDDDRGPAPPSSSSAVKASVVVTSFAEPSSRTCSDARSPLAGCPLWPATWKCPPAEVKLAGAPPVGATESASHLPTEWMCRPWNPGASCPSAVVCTVTVAKPPVNSNVGGGDGGAVGELQIGGERRRRSRRRTRRVPAPARRPAPRATATASRSRSPARCRATWRRVRWDCRRSTRVTRHCEQGGERRRS